MHYHPCVEQIHEGLRCRIMQIEERFHNAAWHNRDTKRNEADYRLVCVLEKPLPVRSGRNLGHLFSSSRHAFADAHRSSENPYDTVWITKIRGGLAP
jgi:hypothetical protein